MATPDRAAYSKMKGNVAIKRTLRSAIFLFALGWAENGLAQVCHRDGPDMTR